MESILGSEYLAIILAFVAALPSILLFVSQRRKDRYELRGLEASTAQQLTTTAFSVVDRLQAEVTRVYEEKQERERQLLRLLTGCRDLVAQLREADLVPVFLPDGWHMRLLVIDDDADMAEMMRAGLGRRGYIIDHADRGADGIDAVCNRRYDCVFLDWRLPEEDVQALVGRLQEAQPGLPVVIMTAGFKNRAAAGDGVLPVVSAVDTLNGVLAAVRSLMAEREHLVPADEGKVEDGIPDRDES